MKKANGKNVDTSQPGHGYVQQDGEIVLDPANASAFPQVRHPYEKTKSKFPDPVKTFYNTLPENYPSWHYLAERVKECFNGDVKTVPATFVFDVMTDEREVYSYLFNMDFVKARCFEELDPILTRIEYAVKEPGITHTEVLQRFLSDYKSLFPVHSEGNSLL